SSPKRITRKDIRRPDQFVALTGKIVHLASAYRTQSIVCLALLLAVLLGLWGWDSYRQRQNRLAAREYSRAMSLYRSGKYTEAIDAFVQVKRYNSSSYSSFSLLYQANSYIAAGDSAKATEAVQELLQRERKDTFLRQIALLTLGSFQEKAGRCKEAVSNFAAAESIAGPFKDEALLAKARCSIQNQDFKEGLNAYRQYLTAFPASERANEITLRVQEIEGKIAAGAGK
ncbi:MAG: tetratricopeptide repeat protein, partial [Candidatus Binatota bacterium]